MGEAYKGLTIRLGADVSELKAALRSSDRAISETQRQLRALQRAAKLDPADMAAFGERMDAAAGKARALSDRLTLMRESLRQIRSSEGMAKVADDTAHAALNAQKALDRYNRVDDAIKRLKNSIASAAGYDLKVEDPFKGLETSREVIAKMRELGATAEQTSRYASMARRHLAALGELELAKQVNEIGKLKSDMAVAGAEARSLYAEMARLAAQNPTATKTEAFGEFSRSMRRADEAASALKAELRTLDSALKLDPSNIDAARLKMASMQEQVRLNVALMGSLRGQIEAMRSAGVDRVAASTADLAQETMRAEREVASLAQRFDEARLHADRLGAQLTEARAGVTLLGERGAGELSAELAQAERRAGALGDELAQARARLDSLGNAQAFNDLNVRLASLSASTNGMVAEMTTAESRSVSMRGAMQQLGWAMYSTVTPMMAMFAHQAVSSAEEVDASYRNMRKTVQGTEEDFEALRSAALDYSRTHFTSADQMLEIEAMGGQLGVATESLEEFAVTVSNLDIATNLDAETAATQLGQLTGILNDMTQDDFPRFGDALVRLGNNNATLEDKITDVMLRISSMGTIAGFTTPQLLAWSTAIAATGQGAESSGTAISNTISDIESAVGKGGDALQAFADVAGMAADDFAAKWGSDPSGAMYSFVQGLKDIDESGGSADAALIALGITGVRQKQAVLGLMQTIDGLNANLAMSENAWNGVGDQWGAAGDAAREADAKAQGFSGAIQMLRNNFQTLGVEVGESLAPALTGMNDLVTGATRAYSGLSDTGKMLLNFGAIAAMGLGPATVAVNAVSGAWSALHDTFSGVKSGWNEAVRSTALVNAGLREQVAASGGAVSSNKELSRTYEQMTRSQKLAAGGMTLLKGALGGLGVAAATAAVVALVDGLVEMKRHADDVRDATDGLSSAVEAMDASVSGAADAVAGMSTGHAVMQLGELQEAVRETTEAQAELSRRIADEWGEVNAGGAALGAYVGIIEQLTGKTDENGEKARLTAEEQAKLRAAVEGVNGVMGTSYEVVDAVNGVLSASTDEIARNSDAWVRNAAAAAAQSHLTDLLKHRFDVEADLTDAMEVRGQKAAELAAAEEAGLTGHALQSYVSQLADADAAVDELRADHEAAMKAADDFLGVVADRAMQQAAADMADALRGMGDEAAAAFEAAGTDVDALAGSLVDLGASTADLAKLSGEEWRAVADAYDGTAESVAGTLEGLGVSFDETALEAMEAAQAIIDGLSAMEGNASVALQGVGVDVQGFAEKLAEAGVSTEELNAVGTENLASLASACRGNMDMMVWFIQNYNDTPLVDKEGNVQVEQAQLIDAQGNLYTWNGSGLFDKYGYAAIADTSVVDAQGHLWTWNGSSLQYKSSTGEVFDLMSDGIKQRDRWNDHGLESYEATGTISIFRNITETVTQIFSKPHASGGVVRHAEGGAFAGPLPARGFIATGPTMVTPADMIGEAGAEAFFSVGRSDYIVPLTNRRYAQPFVDLIVDGIASESAQRRIAGSLGSRAQGGTTVVVERQGGLTKADVFDAVRSAVRSVAGRQGDVVLKVDGREFGRAVRSSL